jgi:putative peptide zinc metalloprotease protein
MNLTRVLNVALPEIPARSLADRPPRMPPDVVFKEHIEDGEPIVRVVVADQDMMYRFTPANWHLMQFFDGRRTYEEVAELYSAETGREYSAEEIHEFADSLEALKFWYKSPQEKNIQLMQKSAEERSKLLNSRKSKFGDLSEIAFPAVNPDKFLTWLYKWTSFVFTWWFSLITIIVFAGAGAISIAHWDEIGHDTVEFFSFSHMSWNDLIIFYVLALLTMCWHELAHGLTCKHYGARIPAMGFLLVYLAPAFYTDTSEGFVVATRYQRFIIAMAGAWSELYLYAVATPIWWGTPPGSSIHNAAYLMMLMTGIAGLFINWNPLIKLDGYYMLCEILGIGDLKESSTAYTSAWVKRNVWRLPVEVPYVPKRRRTGFVVYALLSGAYSYTILYILARFVGNVFRNFNPEWSFIPELATAGLIFRSRIRTLVNFMKFVYLDKKERIRAWFASRLGFVGALAVIIFLFLPLWRESADARFILEPAETAIVRNLVPGTVIEVFAKEGMTVAAGAPLLRMRNLPLESRVAGGQEELAVASIRANEAALHYGNLGSALEERKHLAQQSHELQSEASSLQLESPIAGTVLTPRPDDWLGDNVHSGTELVEIANLREMRARVYVSDYDMYKIHLGATARLSVEGFPRLWTAQVVAITPASSEIDPGIFEPAKYKALNPLNFYVVDLMIANPNATLKPGMTGAARIYSQRRSLASHFAHEVVRFFGRKAW